MVVSTQTRSFVNDFLKVGVLNPDYFRTQKSQRDSIAGKTENHIQRFTRTNDRDIRATVTPTEHGVTKVLTDNFNLSLRLTHHRE